MVAQNALQQWISVFNMKCIHLKKAPVYVWAEKTRFLFDFHYGFFLKRSGSKKVFSRR